MKRKRPVRPKKLCASRSEGGDQDIEGVSIWFIVRLHGEGYV